ncbi:MAG TPA: type II secretion system protein [Candidatus Saccharimonadales bacterium]|jgi:prepilin-type N-terminal cleavage/methylation domain-containing protein
MSKFNIKDKKGFTIIEVLIVLAIAGLILLIVFLAVPSLQRNSRNTARKTDVSNILGAMSEYTNNNGGQYPASCGAGACTTTPWLTNAKLGTIDGTRVAFSLQTGPAVPASPAGLDSVVLANYAKCSTASAATATNASKRSLVALYYVETGGANQLQCVESGS